MHYEAGITKILANSDFNEEIYNSDLMKDCNNDNDPVPLPK
jgi:hypothetical protein